MSFGGYARTSKLRFRGMQQLSSSLLVTLQLLNMKGDCYRLHNILK